MKKLPIFIAIMFIISLGACKKEGCLAGKGGNVNLIIHPQHHGDAIPGSTAYIEFNTQSNAGASSNYDLTVQGDPSEEHIHVNGLRCGEYYIYCVGFDSTSNGGQTVFGGIPFVIKSNQTGDVTIHVPVTE